MTTLWKFLDEALQYPKIYWKSRDSKFAYAGYGAGQGIEKNSPLSFGGQAFTPHACQGIWSCFPASLYFSPTTLKQEVWDPSRFPFVFPKVLERKETPTFEHWWMIVNDALEKIKSNHLKKVVLARQTALKLDSKIDPLHVLRMLTPYGNEASLFMLQLDADTAFVGATPEKLFHRKHRKISSEAIAGTKDQIEQWTPKETSEIEAVQLFLHEKFMRCCRDIQWQPLEQKSFGILNHLYQSIRGDLKEEVSDQELFLHLHPTPALGGLPKEAAISYLGETEPLHRGWYGGLFGMVSPQETDMAVTIRSALIRGNEIHLFAGAGIVKDSDPQKEWQELDLKIHHYLRFLNE
ncbi:MAG TPA: isochorismate synthase [Rhabdochlamydiaceae bacterium]|jgi:menaquinone-specific isochorismate synthase|nr:isochorismate synthase [Rhabdochlamydiaceae bacterium]